MALATRCPHCQTAFRVVPDQLKLRAGLVRCGACKQIFNGLEHLLPPEDTPATVMPVPPAAPVAAPEARVPPQPDPIERLPWGTDASAPVETVTPVDPAPALSPPPVTSESDAPPTPHYEPAPAPRAPQTEPENEDPMLRMTLMDFSEFERAAEARASETPAEAAVAAEEFNQAINDLQQSLLNDPKRAASLSKLDEEAEEPAVVDTTEPAFVRQARRQARIGRSLRIGLRVSTALLLLGLLAQGTYVFRDQIAAGVPQAAPLLSRACAALGCSVGLPAQIDAVSIESSELQALASGQNSFVLAALLRNRSATAQTWPNIELTLNDTNEKPVVRRVIGPRDYLLPTQDAAKGLPPFSEQAVKVSFELAQLKASGYRVYLFYP
jgi:predicted Zn finger-like uncharacterized protein